MSQFTNQQLDLWFTYHKPRSDWEKEGYSAIAASHAQCMELHHGLHRFVYERANELHSQGKRGRDIEAKDFQPLHDMVNEAGRVFALTIGAHCPNNSDRYDSVSSIRLFCNGLNNFISNHVEIIRSQNDPENAEKGIAREWWADRYKSIALDELIKARWRASASIACTPWSESRELQQSDAGWRGR